MLTVLRPPGSVSTLPHLSFPLPCPLDKSQSTHEIIPGHAATSRSRSKPRGLQASAGRWGLYRVSRTSLWTVCLVVPSHSLPSQPRSGPALQPAVAMGDLLIAGAQRECFQRMCEPGSDQTWSLGPGMTESSSRSVQAREGARVQGATYTQTPHTGSRFQLM